MPGFSAGRSLRLAVRLASLVIVLASLGFVAERVIATADWGLPRLFQPATLLTLAGGAVAYASILLFISSAWRRLLIWLGEDGVSAVLCHSIYGRSQLAKYLPGNVFHLAGRQYLAMRAGMTPSAVAASALYEHAGLIVAACAITLAGYPLFSASDPWISATGALGLLSIMAALPLALPALWNRWRSWRGKGTETRPDDFMPPSASPGSTLVSWLPVYGLYAAFLIALGTLLLGLVAILTGSWPGTSSILIVSAFAPAWIAGLLAVGAPAGVGVRETVLILLLGPVIGDAEITLAALALRLVTLFGDVLFFGLAQALAPRSINS